MDECFLAGDGHVSAKNLTERQIPRLPLMRELSAKLTEGEKTLQMVNFKLFISPPVTAYAVPAPSSEGANSRKRTF